MREIKFRAWVTDTADEAPYMDYAIKLYNEGGISLNHLLDGAYGELMQFTGLLDKNGKEVYEGDIVKYESIKGQFGLHQVVYLDKASAFLLQAITPASRNPIGMKYLGDIARSNSQYDTRTYELCEVIGNIYENLELLK